MLRNPQYIIPYLRNNPRSVPLPVDANLPWWSYSGIEFADKIMPDKTIFEYGTGGSTLRYSRVAKRILAVEDDLAWAATVQERLAKYPATNVEVICCPFDFDNPEGFESSDYIRAVDNIKPDVVIIDGQDRTFNERRKCFYHVEPKMAPGGWIVVDDFWRYESLLKQNRAKKVRVFESVGPCRFGVTSTAFFEY